MMENNPRVIDLSVGIGARAYGFQNAGFQVACVADIFQISETICKKLLDFKLFIRDDIENITGDELPEAEIITAELLGPLISSTERKAGIARRNTAIVRIIEKKMPCLFLLEVHPAMLIGKRLAETVKGLEMQVLNKYEIVYSVLRDEDISGVPITSRKGYIIGIRKDIFKEEVIFPSPTSIIRSVSLESPEDVDAWYRKISRLPEFAPEKDCFYVRRMGKFFKTDKIDMSFLREMYLVDDIGFRKFTHNECAALKGMAGYDFNKCPNKMDMYRKIMASSNVFVINRIAESLRGYLLRNSINSVSKLPENTGITLPKKGKKKETASVEDYIYPKQSLKKMSVKNLKGLKNMDLLFEKNLTAIMGVNGSGKSTILHALACVYRPYKNGDDYKFSYFFTPNPDSSWKNSEFSITFRDEIDQKEITRVYRKNKDRWSPRYGQRPKRDTYFIGIESCVPEIEKESQMSFIDYQTIEAGDKNASKIIEAAAYILNKDYDQLNYHLTRKKELLGVHTRNNMKYSSLSMGAGEQRVLRILQTVYTAATYSMILIDEIDLLLHVTALKRMIEYLDRIARRRNLQIIFTTHSIEMSRLQDYVDIRYLEPLPQKTMVYNRITPDIIYELNDEVQKNIKIYVEDTLAETIVNVVAENLEMSRYVTILKMGAASNLFLLAASFVLQNLDVGNVMILLDGDVYRGEEDKKQAIKKELSGTEIDHDDKIEAACRMIKQLNLPEKTAPEKHIFNMLTEMDYKNELVETACKLNAVSDSHQWVDLIVKRQGEKEDIVLYKIISLVSEHEKWADYIREVREWLKEKKKDFDMSVN